MTSSKKKRMSMLDSLAAAGGPSPALATSMMTTNRALRSARDAVDSHHVWELDPANILVDRIDDRLDPGDVHDLIDAIETNGQTVPILVRRHPSEPDRYLLVYGRRRLEAIRQSDKVDKVRALVATLDDDAAVRAQISENMARRDLSFIEKALFAQELIAAGFGNQSQVAEVLTVTKSSVSMALSIVDLVGADLIRAIGAAHGIGRPRWEALGQAIEQAHADRAWLAGIAEEVHTRSSVEAVVDGAYQDAADISVQAFEAVARAVGTPQKPARTVPRPGAGKQVLEVSGRPSGSIRRTAQGVSIALESGPFADWVAAEAQDLINELHGRWQRRSED